MRLSLAIPSVSWCICFPFCCVSFDMCWYDRAKHTMLRHGVGEKKKKMAAGAVVTSDSNIQWMHKFSIFHILLVFCGNTLHPMYPPNSIHMKAISVACSANVAHFITCQRFSFMFNCCRRCCCCLQVFTIFQFFFCNYSFKTNFFVVVVVFFLLLCFWINF